MSVQTLKAVTVECTDCGAQHVKPERVDADDPPEIISGRCYASHPARGADFEGCGQDDVELIVVEVDDV